MKYFFSSLGALVLVGLVGCGDADDGTGGSSATGSSGSSSGTAAGTVCGAAVCNANEVCTVPVGSCSAAPTCQPATDSAAEQVVCGCDGMNYKNAYQASAHGGTAHDGACAPPANQFTCIYEYQIPIYCDLGTEYCRLTTTGDIYGLECVPVPAACPSPIADCNCLMDACSGNYCGIDKANNAVTVLCQ